MVAKTSQERRTRCYWCLDAADAPILLMRRWSRCDNAADAPMLLMRRRCWCVNAADALIMLIRQSWWIRISLQTFLKNSVLVVFCCKLWCVGQWPKVKIWHVPCSPNPVLAYSPFHIMRRCMYTLEPFSQYGFDPLMHNKVFFTYFILLKRD